MSDGELASLVATIDTTVAVDPLVTTSGRGVNVVNAGLVPYIWLSEWLDFRVFTGALGGTRTPNPLIRRQRPDVSLCLFDLHSVYLCGGGERYLSPSPRILYGL